MAHNLDVNDGQASFATARVDAWHRLGTTLESSFTAEQALHHAHLSGWNLRKVELLASDDDTGSMVPLEDKYAVVRDNPVTPDQVDPLGVVGRSYTIMPNESLVGLLDALVDESGAHYETAGAIDGGRKVFVTMKLPDHILVGGEDKVDTYLAAMTSHDGTLSTRLMVTPVRIVCQNTLNVALQSARSTYRVRHTHGATSSLISEARSALEFSFGYLEEFQTLAEQLINTEMTSAHFRDIIEENFGAEPDASESAQTRRENKLQELSDLFNGSPTQENIRGTAWAGFNALTEHYDHFAGVQAIDPNEKNDRRAARAVLDPGPKSKALRLILDGVGL